MNNQIIFNKTFIYNLSEFSFGNLPHAMIIEIFKDGRPFSHFIEKWLSFNFELHHIMGCKSYDFTDTNDENIKYDQKTFTSRGCKFMPSNMIGEGRKFDKEKWFDEIWCAKYGIAVGLNDLPRAISTMDQVLPNIKHYEEITQRNQAKDFVQDCHIWLKEKYKL
jgi:hypothetical protein